LSFSYNKDNYALKDISMDIYQGKTISIIGESGSGKTTIVDILLGLYRGHSGEIKINDIDLYDYDINSFRERVGVVSQDSFLFDQSIRQNLLWANHLATDDDMWNVLKQSQIADFVRSQKNGLDTIVGNRGARMSGGQRQRISLARALIKKPDLIILDEATSSLDVDSERKIQESIDNLNQSYTFLIIAHRLSTIKNSDYIYVLDNGSIFEEGSYDDLIRDENSYLSRMGNLQKS
jgi:ABC-type multidrug transport system fused ATPase/permease subunit